MALSWAAFFVRGKIQQVMIMIKKLYDLFFNPIPDPESRKEFFVKIHRRGISNVIIVSFLIAIAELSMFIIFKFNIFYHKYDFSGTALALFLMMSSMFFLSITAKILNKEKIISIINYSFPYTLLVLVMVLIQFRTNLSDEVLFYYFLFVAGIMMVKYSFPFESLLLYSSALISFIYIYHNNVKNQLTLDIVNCIVITFIFLVMNIVLFSRYRNDFFNKKTMRKLLQDKSLAEQSLLVAKEEAERQRERAEQATQAKSNFLANMSHEIRTPMNAVIGLNDLLAKTELSAKQQDYVDKIASGAKNLLRIINDILDTSKIEAGKMVLEETEFRLDEVLVHVSNVVAKAAFDKGIELVIRKGPDVPPVLRGDPLRLGQVLINLCSNSIKFTTQGQVTLSIQADELGDGQANLCFSVQDTGIGMSPDQIHRLFNAFSQADASTTRRFGGTGLGLMISKNIVELMGGRIQVQSREGQGSCFSFTVRLATGGTLPTRCESSFEKLRGINVLVVEDNPAARQVVHEYVVRMGMNTILAASGEEAVEVMDESVDLVLMDWHLGGGINGAQAWEKIRGKMEGSSLPRLIFVTAYEKEDVLDGIQERESIGIITKPVDQAMLMTSIMAAFGATEAESDTCRNDESVDLEGIRGARILLVEDNEVNQQVARENLENEGFWVDVADNGLIAVEKALQNRYDLILMDVQMPVMDGLAATREIRKTELNAQHSRIPIIALTADVMESARDKVFQSGMDGCLTKPIDRRALHATLKQWIPEGKREPFAHREDGKEVGNDAAGMAQRLGSVLKSVSVDEGLARVSGNSRLYGEILVKFARNYQDFREDIGQSLHEQDMEGVKRRLHTLKGVSANIGAKRIQELSSTLERNLLAGENILESEPFRELSAALDLTLEQIYAWMAMEKSAAVDSTNQPSISMDTVKQRLLNLREALENYDAEAGDIFSGVRDWLMQQGLEEQTAHMEQALAGYDFEKALGLCREMDVTMSQAMIPAINQES